MQKWWEKAWQQKGIKNTYHCKNLRWKLNKKAQDGNTTRVSVCSQTQHPLRKSPSFAVKLHTSEDQKHNIQYLHSVKHSKMSWAWS